MVPNLKPRSHEDFNSLPVAYFSIQILVKRWVEFGFIQSYATGSELKSSCERSLNEVAVFAAHDVSRDAIARTCQHDLGGLAAT